MNPQRKIATSILVWVAVTAVFFMYAMPKFSDGLLTLQQNDKDQQEKIRSLSDQVRSLADMQSDLDLVNKEPVKPGDFFTSDLKLVNEIKHIEDIAKASSVDLALTISGSADQAQAVPNTASRLFTVPYSIKTTGGFPNTVQFLEYFENSYFASPVASIDMNRNQYGQVESNIVTNFFIRK